MKMTGFAMRSRAAGLEWVAALNWGWQKRGESTQLVDSGGEG